MNNPYMYPANETDSDVKKVVIVDLQIPIRSLVVFSVKVALAIIPATFILLILGFGLLSWLRLFMGH